MGQGSLPFARQVPQGLLPTDGPKGKSKMSAIFFRQVPSRSAMGRNPFLKIIKMRVFRPSALFFACCLLRLPAQADVPIAPQPFAEAAAVRLDGDTGAGPLGYFLYPDITREQSDLAHLALAQAYSAKVKRAHKSVDALRALETENGLPPLSQLLSLAIDVMRYQNGDFEDAAEEKALRKAIAEASEQGSYACQQALRRKPGHPTYLLILGGIRGFTATLKIHDNPSQAMSDGFQALKLLEKAYAADPRLKDCFLGTGIFHCTAANAPLVVRATLKIIGRSVSMKAGLEALRKSAYEGQYTPVSSQLFLIQFLSPYEDELAREKREIFRSLEAEFPHNAYFTFLRNDENLCFHPDSFFAPATRAALGARIAAFSAGDSASRRYANLVRWQYTLLDPAPEKKYAPDSAFRFRDFGFYPTFIEALRWKLAIEDTLDPGERPPQAVLSSLRDKRDACLALIADSPMNPARKRYYAWHITDGLRWAPAPARARPAATSTTSR